ncbi:MAG TPA: hypothetical protein ACFCUD_14925 [Cyclobacteriaceae bacterium]
MRILLNTFFITISSVFFNSCFAQDIEKVNGDIDSLKREIMQLDVEVDNIQLGLQGSKKSLKRGIFVATLGYSITIVGGQLLGTNPTAGEALLYAGGAVGIAGTALLVKAFDKLGASRRKRKDN